MEQSITDWLLDKSDPAIRYRTLTELLDEPKNSEVVKTVRSKILQMAEVNQLFDKQYQDGLWLFVNPKTKKVIYDRQHYKNIYYTLATLQYLAEFGLDTSDPRVKTAVENALHFIGEFDSLLENAVLSVLTPRCVTTSTSGRSA